MSTGIKPTADACGCCTGPARSTPAKVENRPGLPAIAYRTGTYTEFRETMIAALATKPALRDLRTRDTDDYSIALIDAFAAVADVLTFYQERLANEAYLRTAIDRASVLHLARLIGYELRPGVATEVDLSFTLDTSPTAPATVSLETGVKVQSVPGPGEDPHIFETVQPIEARPAWNAMRPRRTRRHSLLDGKGAVLGTYRFEGLATGLKTGDLIAFSANDQTFCCVVQRVTPDPQKQWTVATVEPLEVVKAIYLTERQQVKGRSVHANVFRSAVPAAKLQLDAELLGYKLEWLFKNIAASVPPAEQVLTFRTRAAIFGHNAPAWSTLPRALRYGEWTDEFKPGPFKEREGTWNQQALSDYIPDNPGDIYLDALYPTIVEGGFVLLRSSKHWSLFRVDAAREESVADFTLSAKVTRLSLAPSDPDLSEFSIRNATVHGQDVKLPLAREPIEDLVHGNRIELDGMVEGLSIGHRLIVCGEPEQYVGTRFCENVTVSNVEQSDEDLGFTILTLAGDGLAGTYLRSSVTIYGNIARATDGETVEEVLGSGDATRPFQRFTLLHAPLTFLSGETPEGAVSTLEIRINNVLWHEVPFLNNRSPSEQVFVTRRDNDGNTTVIFGDGRTGARLPSGVENVRARYRKGSGLGGLVRDAQLTQLMTRPAGVKDVTNPRPAQGGGDPQTLDTARNAAPTAVKTLGRAVSLRDYEDFSRGFTGIAKALATSTWTGHVHCVLLTIAGSDGREILRDDPVFRRLTPALANFGDPHAHFQVASFVPRRFRLGGRIFCSSDYDADRLHAAVEAALRRAFGFEARDFMQPAALSEAVAVIHRVEGVVGVDLDQFHAAGNTPSLQEFILAAGPSLTGQALTGAELLMLQREPLEELRVIR